MSINQERIKLFTSDLNDAFQIKKLTIEDESHLHAGHAGAASGGGHFKILITAPEFSGMNSLARHRAVYAALAKRMPSDIHALTIMASTPEDEI
jgi:BolA family transcriptional regulator, general stress-responsive regulator